MRAMSLGANIRTYRTERGWTQEEAARAAGLRLNTWVRVELGMNVPTLDTLQAIAAALGVGLDELVDNSPAAS